MSQPAYDPGAVIAFTGEYFAALGAPLSLVAPGLYRTELSAAQLAEADGKRPPAVFFGPPREELTTLYLVFGEAEARAHPEAEWVLPGSDRFDRILSSCLRLGRASRFGVAWDDAFAEAPPALWWAARQPAGVVAPRLCWRPFVMVQFELQKNGVDQAPERLAAVVDAVSGAAYACGEPAAWTAWTPADVAALPTEPLPARITPADAMVQAEAALVADLLQRDDAWAHDLNLRLESELRGIKAFYRELARHREEGLADEEARRLAEVRHRLAPRIDARARLLTLMWLPVIEAQLVREARLYSPAFRRLRIGDGGDYLSLAAPKRAM